MNDKLTQEKLWGISKSLSDLNIAEKGDYLQITPGEIRVLKASDYLEPINVTELRDRVEALEQTIKTQNETIANILESLTAVHGLLVNLRTNRRVL